MTNRKLKENKINKSSEVRQSRKVNFTSCYCNEGAERMSGIRE